MTSPWIPLESNPEVLTKWAEKLGLSNELGFEDVYGLDKEMLALLPQPTRAVILLFPITTTIESRRIAEDSEIETNGQAKLDDSLFYIKQTIPNACGTIGLLHAIINSDLTMKGLDGSGESTVNPGTPLAKFKEDGRDKTPLERAALLEKTTLFAATHAEVAQGGQSAVPDSLDTDLHFTVFVQSPNPDSPGKRRLIELDGRRNSPIDLGESENLLEEVANVVKDKYIATSTNMNFSMIAMGPKGL